MIGTVFVCGRYFAHLERQPQPRRRVGGYPGLRVRVVDRQARMLRRFSTSDRVVVVVSGDEPARHQTAGCVLDLAMFFDRIRAIEFPSGATPATILQLDSGPEPLQQLMSRTRPLMTYRVSGQGFLASPGIDTDPPDASPVP